MEEYSEYVGMDVHKDTNAVAVAHAKFYPATDYIKALRVQTLLQQEMAEALEQCDVMAVPATTTPAPELASEDVAGTDVKPGTTATSYPGGNTFIGNMTGYPAISIPCGFSEGAPSLPLSIMFYGRPFDEPTILRVAHAYERATDWHERRPPI